MEGELHVKRGLEETNPTLDHRKKFNSRQTHQREYTTVLVSNLPKSINQGKLRKQFADCGRIRYVDIVDSFDGSSRLAKIEFQSHDECLSALTKTHKLVGNNEITVATLEGCTLWITNFPPYFDVKHLKQLFQTISVVVLSIRLPSKRFNPNRRFAYVDVTSKRDVVKCIEALNDKQIQQYKLVVKLSNPAERQKRTDAASLERREVFIRNLDPQLANEDALRTKFQQCGQIESIHIPPQDDNIINACAFITFSGKEEANVALKSNGTTWNDRNISVTLADRKSYLERQEVKELMSKTRNKETTDTITLYPISDKISKEQIRRFLQEQDCVKHPDEIKKIYLVTDYHGAIVQFKDMKVGANCMLKLQGRKFMNKVINCGTIVDLQRNKPEGQKNHERKPCAPQHITLAVEKEISNESPKQSSKPAMSNNDFRRMFLGK